MAHEGTQLLTLSEVAKRLSCSKKTVMRRVDDGSLDVVYIGNDGKGRRVSEAALALFVTAQTEAWKK